MPEALPQNGKQWLAMVITAVTTLGGSWLLFKGESTNSRDTAQSKVIDSLLIDNQSKNALIVEYQKQLTIQAGIIAEQQKELNKLQIRVAAIEETHGHEDASELLELVINKLPYPAWIQEVEKQNWFLNDAYVDDFSVSRKSFWNPVNIVAGFPDALAAQFVENDMRVVRGGVPQILNESFPYRVMQDVGPKNPAYDWQVLKAPLRISGRAYIFGACWPDGEENAILEAFR